MTALITGASSGIGEELARLFAADGEDVVLVARSESKLNELANQLSKSHSITATVIVIPGWKNRLMVTSTSFVPRFVTRKLVARMQRT